jgi:hypothetical protein
VVAFIYKFSYLDVNQFGSWVFLSAMAPTLSFICSHGRTATTWITRALNSHSDITAVHGPISPPVTQVEGLDSKTLLTLGWDTGKFFALSLDEMADEMAQFSAKPFKARVHALNAFRLTEKIKAEKPNCHIRAVNVIRHPITRIQSFQAKWTDDWKDSKNMRSFFEGYFHTNPSAQELQKAAAAHKIALPDDQESKLFVCAVTWLVNDFQDFATDIPVFVHERLIADPEYWISMLRAAFGPNLTIPFTHIRNVQNLKPENASSVRNRSSAEIYANWAVWKRFVFNHFALKYNIPAMYRRFGYEFDI